MRKRDVQTPRFFAPFEVAESMNGDAASDDETLRVSHLVEADALVRPRGVSRAVVRPANEGVCRDEIGERWRRKFHRLAQRRGDECLPAFDRLACFSDVDPHPVFEPRDAPELAIDLSHRVIITGANDPTASSCPSREQITPG